MVASVYKRAVTKGDSLLSRSFKKQTSDAMGKVMRVGTGRILIKGNKLFICRTCGIRLKHILNCRYILFVTSASSLWGLKNYGCRSGNTGKDNA
jgi:hypothetical protein